MLTVLTYFWQDRATAHKQPYTVDDVRRLQRQVARNLSIGHRFAVATDRPELFYGDWDIHPIGLDRTKHVPGTCFVRLMTFHPEGQNFLGERVLQIDLDTLIVGNLDPLVERDEDLVLWRNPSRIPWDDPKWDMLGRPYYNTSMLLHRCGTRPDLWLKFDPKNPICRDDQWWLSYLVGRQSAYWDGSNGVYRLGRSDTPGSGVNGSLPDNARVVTFPGSEGKWFEPHIRQANPWIEQHLAVA